MPRPITPADRNAMAELVRDAIFRVFQPDAGVTLGGQPIRNFLAGAAPTNLFSRIQWDMGREACRRWASGKSDSILPSRESYLRDTCTPYITGAFGAPGGGAVEPGFEGGQCAARGYSFNLRRFFADGTDVGVLDIPCSAGWYGPISTFRRFTAGQHQVGIQGFNSDGGSRESVIIRGGQEGARVEPFGFARCDGGLDNCGDAPATYTPGLPVTGVPGPAPIPNPPGNPWPFGPVNITLNPDGTITIDFGDDTPPVTIDPGAPPPGSPGDVAPTTPGSPGTPATTGSGGESSGTAPTGSELSGVGVEILTFPPAAARFQNNARQPFRGAGYIAMGYPGLLGIDMSGGVINLSQFFHAQQRGLSSWRVSANIGFNLRCTPYYREVSPE